MRQLVCSTRANGLAFCWLAVGGCVFEVKNGRTGVSTLNSDSGLTNSDSVYVDDRLIGLTEYATFCNEDATAQLAKLLSESEWQRLRSVEAADLWECTLVYVELAAIILLFADNPFGSVCEVAKAEWPLELVRRRWEVGCLLERSGALVEKLAKFCVQTLRYMSTPFHWALECLTIPDRVQYASRVRYDAATARAAFQKRAKELYVTLTAPEFIRLWVDRHSIIPKKDLVEKAGGIENSLAHFLAKLKGPLRPLSWVAASTNPKGPYRRTGGSFLRCAHIRTTGHILNRERAREILWDLLGGSLAWNKLDAMKEIDFMACSLAYVELAAIVERVIFQAFGSAAPSLLKKFEAVITDKRIVYAWIGGCILQFAQVPISDLIHFCALDLHYQPSTDYWTLECIRQGPEDIRRERASGDPSVRLTELLAGFQEKMSVTEFAELAALKRRDKATRLRQRASAHRLNENTHTQKPDGPRGVQLTSSHQLNVQFSAARLLAFSTKVKTGAGEDKTGAGEDKTGAGDDKTGAGDDKSGAGDDKNGVVLVGVEKVMRKRKEIDQSNTGGQPAPRRRGTVCRKERRAAFPGQAAHSPGIGQAEHSPDVGQAEHSPDVGQATHSSAPLDPEFMYCHPKDMIEFLHWAEDAGQLGHVTADSSFVSAATVAWPQAGSTCLSGSAIVRDGTDRRGGCTQSLSCRKRFCLLACFARLQTAP